MKYNQWNCRFLTALCIVFLQLLFNNVNAQATSTYIFRLGNDTVAYEQYTRSKELIEGDILSLFPRLMLNHFRIVLGTDGTVKSFESASSYFTGGEVDIPFMKKNGKIEDTLVVQEYMRNGKIDTFFSGRFSVNHGAVPNIDNNDVAMFEQMLVYASLSGKDSVAIQRFTNAPMNSYIKKKSNGLFESKVFFYPVYLKLNANQQIISLDATSSTIKTIATRTSPVDFKNLINYFAKKEKLMGFAGSVSPVDTGKVSFKGGDFQIIYGRPYKRGREIFGKIVPWNKVWRLGANYATHFSTSKDLQFGEFSVPAGRYTLWMIPRQGGDSCELIINKAVNIFGTQYDKTKDLIRIPMVMSALSKSIEQLTIRINETNDGGEINIQWDTLQALAIFKMK